jgi:hypothetical protein
MGIARGLSPPRLTRVFRRERGPDPFALALAFAAVTWLPMALLALQERLATGQFPPIMLRFETHVRFLFTAPLVVLASAVTRDRIEASLRQLLEGGYVRVEDRARYEALVARAQRLRNSRLVDLALAVLAVASLGLGGPYQTGQGAAAWWENFVGLPILRFLLLGALWRWLVWGSFLARVSQLDLGLVACHADHAGGLGFLAQPSEAFGLFAFAMASIVAAERASDLAFLGVRVSLFENQLITFAALTTLLSIAPLLPFSGRLILLRERAYRSWGAHFRNSAAAYEERSLAPGASGEPPPLEDKAVHSLMAKARAFELVDEMRPFPFSSQLIVQNALAAFLPMVPVLLTQVSLDVIAPPLLRLL